MSITSAPSTSSMDLDFVIDRLGALLTGAVRTPKKAPDTPLLPRRDVMCESSAFLATILDSELGWIDDCSVVFVPSDSSSGTGGDARVVEYGGSLTNGGDEVSLEETFFLAHHEYAVSPYVPIVGPTMVRFGSIDDVAAFVSDADLARRTGRFPEVLLHPAVELSDPCTVGGWDRCSCAEPGRLFVSADGEVAVAPGGTSLGYATDGFEAARAALASLEGCVDRVSGGLMDVAAVRLAVTERPWLGAYLSALTALRTLRIAGHTDLVASGFGHRLTPTLDDTLDQVAHHAVLLFDDADTFVRNSGGQIFKVGRDAAVIIEAFGVTGSVSETTAIACRELGLDPMTAGPVVDAAIGSVMGSILASSGDSAR